MDVLLYNDDILQIACPSQHEMTQWQQALVFALSAADTSESTAQWLSCCLLLSASGHVLLCHEQSDIDFVRTLAQAHLTCVRAVAVMDDHSTTYVFGR